MYRAGGAQGINVELPYSCPHCSAFPCADKSTGTGIHIPTFFTSPRLVLATDKKSRDGCVLRNAPRSFIASPMGAREGSNKR